MLRSRSIRAAAAAVAATASLGTLAVAGLAAPSYASGSQIKCTTVAGNANSTITLSGCTGNTGGSSKPIPAGSFISGGKIKWVNGTSTTVTIASSSTETDTTETAVCPAGTSEVEAKGKVTADTTGSAPVGGAAKGEVCVDPNLNVSNEPGSVFKFK
jgi:hypothetical protein